MRERERKSSDAKRRSAFRQCPLIEFPSSRSLSLSLCVCRQCKRFPVERKKENRMLESREMFPFCHELVAHPFLRNRLVAERLRRRVFCCAPAVCRRSCDTDWSIRVTHERTATSSSILTRPSELLLLLFLYAVVGTKGKQKWAVSTLSPWLAPVRPTSKMSLVWIELTETLSALL